MRFNENAVNPRKTTNHEGSIAYMTSPESELYGLVCTSMLSNKTYEKVDETIERIRKLIVQCDSEFVCKLSIYAREQMKLRSIPIVLIVECIKSWEGQDSSHIPFRSTVAKIIQRPDELTEILAYFQVANNRTGSKKLNKLPNCLKKGIADAFTKFDGYQLSKYNRDTQIKLKDVLFLTHPKPDSDEQQQTWNRLINGELEIPYTWETELSNDDGRTKKEKWETLIKSGKIGYMALLRNLRNIIEADVDCFSDVCKRIGDSEQVKRSKQLPFRFFSAYMMLNKDIKDTFKLKEINNALESAIVASVENLNGFSKDEKILIASDVSSSMMMKKISPKSVIEPMDIGLLMGQLLASKCSNCVTGFFGDFFKLTSFEGESVLKNTIELKRREGEVGYSTNGHKVLEYLIENKITLDKVMIFTDCQLWSSSYSYSSYSRDSMLAGYWNEYKKINPNAELFLFDLAGYGRNPLDVETDKSVYLISGFSEKIFEVVESLKNSKKIVDVINNYV